MKQDESIRTPPGIVDCALYTDGVRRGGLVELNVALETAQEVDDWFVWIGLHEPTAAEFEAVTAEFDLHPLAVKDAVGTHQRAKLETYGDIVFVVLKTVRYVDPTEVIEVGEIMVFLGPKFIIVVRRRGAGPLTAVRHQLEADPQLLRAGPGAVLYTIVDHIVDEYSDAADGISTDIDQIELAVLAGSRPNHDAPPERLYKLIREVLEFRRAVRPMAAPLGLIGRGDVALVDTGTAKYFRDAEGHILRAAERVDMFAELLTNALVANLAQIQSRQNADLRKITAWVAIAGANTLIAGIYGQNFAHMPELHWKFGYPTAIGLILTVSTLLYLGFRRNHWI